MLEEPNSLRKTMSISLTRKVDFPMLDLAGIAYFPRIYDLAHRFFEDAWLEICGVSYPYIINEMKIGFPVVDIQTKFCLLYTSPSPRDPWKSRMPSSA